MKVKLLLATLLALMMSASSANAVKPPPTGPNCKPKVTVVLKGTLASDPTGSSMSVNVTRANRHGSAYATGSQPVSVGVNPDTKVRRQGKKTLADLEAGDRVVVQSRVCKAELANGAKPALTAVRVTAHPASA